MFDVDVFSSVEHYLIYLLFLLILVVEDELSRYRISVLSKKRGIELVIPSKKVSNE